MSFVLERILNSLKRFAKHTAIIDQGKAYTYEELNQHSDKIATYLARFEVQKDSKVVFLMRRSYQQLATFLAIWKLGAAYIPLDPKTPNERIGRILNTLDASCLICDPPFLHKVADQPIHVLTLTDPAFIEIESQGELQVKQSDLAYIIFTSGSTGEPKGVMINHENLSNHITWLIQDFSFNEHDCFSFNSSMAFDFSVACTILPLSVGATLVITTEVDALDMAAYCQQLTQYKISFAKWTPSYFKVLTDYLKQHPIDLSSFRFIMVAGEELLTNYAEEWFKLYPHHTLINEYGPTETSVGITTHPFTQETLNRKLLTVPIGKPAIHSKFYVVDSDNNLLEENQVGELWIGGTSVGVGYYNQPEMTAERFIKNPFETFPPRLYRTGDLVQKLSDGTYLYLGRIDHQVKVNGYRIELNEIEHHLLKHPAIKHAKLTIEKDALGNPRIIAYLVTHDDLNREVPLIKEWLSEKLPLFMIPQRFCYVTHIPTNNNGKVDFSRLKKITETASIQLATDETTNGKITKLIGRYTGIANPDPNTTFLYLGLNSLLLSQFVQDINQCLHCNLTIPDLFTYTNIAVLAEYIDELNHKSPNEPCLQKVKRQRQQTPIAIIAMDCKLPGANGCEELWEICQNGRETIEHFPPKDNRDDKRVYARGTLQDIEYFDAKFFGFNTNDAHLTDPQFRLLLESSWKSLEKAGYIPEESHYKTGVFVSTNDSTYLFNPNYQNYVQSFQGDRFAVQRLVSPQCLATKIAYSLNCTGPSLTVQTACSGSLVAVVLACQQLSEFQCDIAIAGGVSITTPQHQPYTFQEGNIFSPTGHCKPFAALADGTVFSNGLGTVVLKRLDDAIQDNDTIISVIYGASTNNDGAGKMSFTAPSVKGQMECILSAQTSAKIEASTLQYIEAHGTGTFLGDPIEIAALTKAFRRTAKQNQFCAIGSLKANIGHTHVAAGVAGLIKTSLALQHKLIPPSIHCDSLNPNIDWENSPFYVNKNLQYWPQTTTPRRAAVSAFGVGGSNAHVILQEAPPVNESMTAKQPFMLLLSAKTPHALKTMQKNLVEFFKNSKGKSDTLLANAAYTLQVGRKKFPYTFGIVCETVDEAITKLQEHYGHFILSEDRASLKNLNWGQNDLQRTKKCASNFGEITFVPNNKFSKFVSAENSTPLAQTLNAIEFFPTPEELDPSFSYLICTALTKLWCHGVNFHWAHYYGNRPLKRIALPTYPFEKKRYWFDEVVKTPQTQNSSVEQPTVNLYAPIWNREDSPLEDIEIEFSNEKFVWLIFANDTKLCSHTLKTLEKQKNPIWVIRSNEDYQIIDRHIHINPTNESHYERMVQTIFKSGHKKCVILHFWSMNQRESCPDVLNGLELYQTFFSGLFLTKTLYNHDKRVQLACLMISNQLQNVLGNETIIPSISGILSLCRVISLENSNFKFSSIDIDYNLPAALIPIYSNHFIRSIVSNVSETDLLEPSITSFRLGYCWRASYQTLERNVPPQEPLFKTNGTYFITGGLGAMGLTIANWIADQVPAHIILLSRTPLPSEERWDVWLKEHDHNDQVSQTIQTLKAIQKKGANLKIIAADVADLDRMKTIVKKLQKESPIAGVFHLAGIAGEGLSVLKDTPTIHSVLSPKVQGTYVLSKLFKTTPLDFFVSASSLTALAGGIGQLDYCAANLFLDYFFSGLRLMKCKRILTLNWNSWSSIGMAAHLGTSKTHEKLYFENSLSPKEAMQYLEQAMRSQRKQIIISRHDPLAERKRIIAAFRNNSPTFHLTKQQNQLTQLEAIWKSSLGIDEILPEETFYSLGGDSLLAIQLLDRLEKSLKISLSLQEFTHVTTFSSLYDLIKCKPLKCTRPIILLSADESSNKPSIYFIHPLGGSIFNFIALRPHLSYSANYYAIQDPELSSNKPLFHSIRDMAAYYAKEIAQHTPRTPIVLIGASLGGNIAIEMVSFLSTHNIQVNKIILIDSWACLNKLEQITENLSLNSLATIRTYYGEHSREYARIKARLSWLRTYKPSYVEASVYLLAAETLLPPYSLFKEEAHGWKIFCRGHIVQDSIHGNHDTMFNPNHLPQLGSKISSILENIEEHEKAAEQSTNS